MKLCSTFGPSVADIALGYDHITSAIGAAMADVIWHSDALLVDPR